MAKRRHCKMHITLTKHNSIFHSGKYTKWRIVCALINRVDDVLANVLLCNLHPWKQCNTHTEQPQKVTKGIFRVYIAFYCFHSVTWFVHIYFSFRFIFVGCVIFTSTISAAYFSFGSCADSHTYKLCDEARSVGAHTIGSLCDDPSANTHTCHTHNMI